LQDGHHLAIRLSESHKDDAMLGVERYMKGADQVLDFGAPLHNVLSEHDTVGDKFLRDVGVRMPVLKLVSP